MEIDQQAASTNGTDCPVWCVLQHDDTDDLDELVHESAHLAIAGVIPVRTSTAKTVGRARPPLRRSVSCATSTLAMTKTGSTSVMDIVGWN